MPHLMHTGLIEWEGGVFAPCYALFFVVLNLPEERRKHFGIALSPTDQYEPMAEVVSIHELLLSELFIT